jgi:hypothetical protein
VDYSDRRDAVNPVRGGPGLGGGLSTEHAAAVVVLGSLVFLILIRRGFRGVGVPGVGGVKLG